MHHDLRERVRLAAGRKRQPTAAVIDSQSVKGSEMIARDRRGYDAGKKINGTKRHIAVDTLGLLLTVLVTAASVQDRDAGQAGGILRPAPSEPDMHVSMHPAQVSPWPRWREKCWLLPFQGYFRWQ
jgi:DDE family transposase